MPGISVEFHPAAKTEAEGAQRWYADRSTIAARAFLTELIESVRSASEAPERWPFYMAGTHRYYFPRFPFSLVYRVTAGTVVIVAVAHHRQKPGYWAARH